MTANNVVITLMEDLCVAAMWDFNSTLTKTRVLVSQSLQSPNFSHKVAVDHTIHRNYVQKRSDTSIGDYIYLASNSQ